jgi:gamma-tubulin complex component 2
LNALWSLKIRGADGDSVTETIMNYLLEQSSVPYMKTLHSWLGQGVLDDPYQEFMILYNNEGPWDDKYSLAREHVLKHIFPTTDSIERAMAAGKYWNAIRTCKDVKDKPHTGDSSDVSLPPLAYNINVADMSTHIHKMYNMASQGLVNILMTEYGLFESLQVMKRYFLLDQGDFFVHFLDAAEDELRKDTRQVSRGRVQHWLNLSVMITDSNTDKLTHYKHHAPSKVLSATHIRCRFSNESLVDHLEKLNTDDGDTSAKASSIVLKPPDHNKVAEEGLTGIDAFYLELPSIPFPTSLVLSRNSLSKYQFLFRHLFYAKHVERSLVSVWQNHQAMKELQSIRGLIGPTFLLRQRMLHFVQNLIYYMMFEIIEPNWEQMESAIFDSARNNKEYTVDDVLQVHGEFLQRTLEACLLTNRDLVSSSTKLMATCLLYADQMKLFFKSTRIDDDRKAVAQEKHRQIQRNLNDRGGGRATLSSKDLQDTIQKDRQERQNRVHRQTRRVEREITNDSYRKMISRFDVVFSENLKDFMLQLMQADDLYHSHKVNLCIRLDYNGYVTESIGLVARQ